MFELPLFPLNTVLFPGTPISLHIFEPRYKLMIEQCIQNQQPFGIVLIHEGTEALGPLAEPYPIGCTAQITQVERLDDGRLNILAMGLERFEIHALSHEQPYLVGTVKLIPLDEHDEPVIQQAGHRLRPWVERYISVLSQVMENIRFEADQLPDDPLALANMAAALLQIPSYQKQTLLAVGEATDFLTAIRTLYRREVALMSAIVERDPRSTQGVFSLN